MRELLDHAAANSYGIPAFNVNNLEQVQAVMQAASEVGAPVILTTELQRSSRAMESRETVDAILADIDQLANGVTKAQLDKLKDDVRHLARSNVEVYGAIYLKTDGQQLITAFKIESGSDLKKWFWFRYRIEANGELVRVSE